MSNCNPCSGTTPGILTFPGFPPPVGASSTTNSSSSGSGGTGTLPANSCPTSVALPVVESSFITPAIGGSGQFVSLCASTWAVPGNTLVFQPLGNLRVTGVGGDVVTYQNISMPAGFQVQAGTRIFQDGPAGSAIYQPGAQLSNVYGDVNGSLTFINPTAFGSLRGVNIGGTIYWQPVQGLMYMPLEVPTLLTPSSTTTPIPAGSASQTITYTLPALPTNLPPAFGAVLTVRLVNPTAETSFANGFTAVFGGVEMARCQYEAIVNQSTIRVIASTFQITYNKVAARTQCQAEVWVHGYFA